MALIQTSGKKVATGIGTTTVGFTMPANLTVGNTVIITLFVSQTIDMFEVAGTAVTNDAVGFDFGGVIEFILHVKIVNSGRNDIVVGFGSGIANELAFSAEEFNDVMDSPTDQVTYGGSTCTSTTTTQAYERVYALGAFGGHNDGTPVYSLTPDYNVTWYDSSASYPNGVGGWKDITSIGAPTATGGQNNIIVTYKLSGGGAPSPKSNFALMTMLGMV